MQMLRKKTIFIGTIGLSQLWTTILHQKSRAKACPHNAFTFGQTSSLKKPHSDSTFTGVAQKYFFESAEQDAFYTEMLILQEKCRYDRG